MEGSPHAQRRRRPRPASRWSPPARHRGPAEHDTDDSLRRPEHDTDDGHPLQGRAEEASCRSGSHQHADRHDRADCAQADDHHDREQHHQHRLHQFDVHPDLFGLNVIERGEAQFAERQQHHADSEPADHDVEPDLRPRELQHVYEQDVLERLITKDAIAPGLGRVRRIAPPVRRARHLRRLPSALVVAAVPQPRFSHSGGDPGRVGHHRSGGNAGSCLPRGYGRLP